VQKNKDRRGALAGDEKASYKWCRSCGLDLALSCYHISREGCFERQPHCKECRRSTRQASKQTDCQEKDEEVDEEDESESEEEEESGMTSAEKKKEANRLNKARSETEPRPIKKKFCCKCLKDKKLEEYYDHPTCYFERNSKCKDCDSLERAQKRASKKQDVEGDEEDDGEMDDDEEEQEEAEARVVRDTAEERSIEADRRNRDLSAVSPKSVSKWCGSCLVLQPVAYYGINVASFFGRKSKCQVCLTTADHRTRAGYKHIYAAGLRSLISSRLTHPTDFNWARLSQSPR
jgi:hypothetical protein